MSAAVVMASASMQRSTTSDRDSRVKLVDNVEDLDHPAGGGDVELVVEGPHVVDTLGLKAISQRGRLSHRATLAPLLGHPQALLRPQTLDHPCGSGSGRPAPARREPAVAPAGMGFWRSRATWSAGRHRDRDPLAGGAGWSCTDRQSDRPAAATVRALGACPRLGVVATGLPVSPADLSERVDLELLVGHDALMAANRFAMRSGARSGWISRVASAASPRSDQTRAADTARPRRCAEGCR